jgi:hypothetical protein
MARATAIAHLVGDPVRILGLHDAGGGDLQRGDVFLACLAEVRTPV